jgi:predicted transcriptional regulator
MSTTVTMPDELHARVRALAETTGRSLEEVLAETVIQGLAYDRWFREQVDIGRRSAEQGPLIPAVDVWADFLARGLVTPESIAQADAEANEGDSGQSLVLLVRAAGQGSVLA